MAGEYAHSIASPEDQTMLHAFRKLFFRDLLGDVLDNVLTYA